MKNVITLISFLLLTTGCVTSKYFINKDYSIDSSKQKKILIYPSPMHEIPINNYELLFEDDGHAKLTLVRRMREKMHKMQMSVAQDLINKIDIEKSGINYELCDQYLVNGNYEIYKNNKFEDLSSGYKIPKKDFLNHVGINAEIVLVFTLFTTENTLEKNNYIFSAPNFGQESIAVLQQQSNYDSRLITNIEYIIWDYSLDQIVKFGKSEIKSSTSGDQTSKERWMNHFNDIILEVFKNTPFYKHYNNEIYLQ